MGHAKARWKDDSIKDKNDKVIRELYVIRGLNSINFKEPMMHFPFVYYSKKDILKTATIMIVISTGEEKLKMNSG